MNEPKFCSACKRSIEAHAIYRGKAKQGVRCAGTGKRAAVFTGNDVVEILAALGRPLTQMQATEWRRQWPN